MHHQVDFDALMSNITSKNFKSASFHEKISFFYRRPKNAISSKMSSFYSTFPIFKNFLDLSVSYTFFIKTKMGTSCSPSKTASSAPILKAILAKLMGKFPHTRETSKTRKIAFYDYRLLMYA